MSDSIYDADDYRHLALTFGADNVVCRTIVTMWNDITLDHDWTVGIVKDDGGDFFLLDKFESAGEKYAKVCHFRPGPDVEVVATRLMDLDRFAVTDCYGERFEALLDAVNQFRIALQDRAMELHRPAADRQGEIVHLDREYAEIVQVLKGMEADDAQARESEDIEGRSGPSMGR